MLRCLHWGTLIGVLVSSFGCQLMGSEIAEGVSQQGQIPEFRVNSFLKVQGKWLSSPTGSLSTFELDQRTGRLKKEGEAMAWEGRILSLGSYPVPGGSMHWGTVAAFEFGFVFVPDGTEVTLRESDSVQHDYWHFPVLSVARGRCPMYVPGSGQGLSRLTNAEGQDAELQQGDVIYLSHHLPEVKAEHTAYEWAAVTHVNDPAQFQIVWLPTACLETLFDFHDAFRPVRARSEQIKRERAEDIERYRSQIPKPFFSLLTADRLTDELIGGFDRYLRSAPRLNVQALRDEIAQLIEIYAWREAYPWERYLPTAPITMENLRLLVKLYPDAELPRIRGHFVNQTRVLVRSKADVWAWEEKPPAGTFGPVFLEPSSQTPESWQAARNRLAASLSQDVADKTIPPEFSSRFEAPFAYDWSQCVARDNCPAPLRDALFLTMWPVEEGLMSWPALQRLSTLMVDLVEVFKIEFLLADADSNWSHYPINTGIHHEVTQLAGLRDIGHIHPSTRALSASFILPDKKDLDVVYFDHKDETYAPGRIGDGSDICAFVADDQMETFIFLANGSAILHQITTDAQSRYIHIPVRTRYGHVTVAVDRENPCWEAFMGGFPDGSPDAPEPVS